MIWFHKQTHIEIGLEDIDIMFALPEKFVADVQLLDMRQTCTIKSRTKEESLDQRMKKITRSAIPLTNSMLQPEKQSLIMKTTHQLTKKKEKLSQTKRKSSMTWEGGSISHQLKMFSIWLWVQMKEDLSSTQMSDSSTHLDVMTVKCSCLMSLLRAIIKTLSGFQLL